MDIPHSALMKLAHCTDGEIVVFFELAIRDGVAPNFKTLQAWADLSQTTLFLHLHGLERCGLVELSKYRSGHNMIRSRPIRLTFTKG